MIEGLSPAAAALLEAFGPGLVGSSRALQLVRLAVVMEERGLRADAVRVCLHALAEAPDDPHPAALARAVLGADVPTWHLPMLHDHARADAYERSLRLSVKPGMLVLDIGTGSGLLAMMAARAGADFVVACEQEPGLAVLAAENVRRNGLSDRVRIVAKHSRDLAVGRDLPRRADLLVSEIVSDDLIGEGVLETVEDARGRLLTSDAVSIPASAAIHVAAVDLDSRARAFVPPDGVAGLDVSACAEIGGVAHRVRREWGVEPVTDSQTLFHFDLTGREVSAPRLGRCRLVAQRSARVTGALQWLSLELGSGITLSTGPDSKSTAWAMQFFRVPTPITVHAGEAIAAHGEHSRSRVYVWLRAAD
jgi:type II protein arginine methyltransferase